MGFAGAAGGSITVGTKGAVECGWDEDGSPGSDTRPVRHRPGGTANATSRSQTVAGAGLWR